MKRTFITVLLVLSLTFLIALESDPSETVGFIKYGLVTTATTNSNVVCVSLDNGVTTAQALANEIGAPGVVDGVSKFNSATQSWETVTYSFVPVPPPGAWQWSGDFAISNGDVLMVNVTADTDYYCAGSLFGDPTYNLVTTATTNSNTVMLPLSKSALATAQAMANDIGVAGIVDGVSEFVSATQSWNTVTYSFVPVPPPGAWQWSGDFGISIGSGYMVNVTADTTWPTIRTNSSKQSFYNFKRK